MHCKVALRRNSLLPVSTCGMTRQTTISIVRSRLEQKLPLYLGVIDLSKIKSSILMQRRDDSSDGDKAIVLHIEVKVAKPEVWGCGGGVAIYLKCHHADNQRDGAFTVMQDMRQKPRCSLRRTKTTKISSDLCGTPLYCPIQLGRSRAGRVMNMAIGTSINVRIMRVLSG